MEVDSTLWPRRSPPFLEDWENFGLLQGSFGPFNFMTFYDKLCRMIKESSFVVIRRKLVRNCCDMSPKLGAKKSTQTFFGQSFSKTLRVMDVRAKNRGRPHQKVRFSAAPVMGRNFLTQGRPGVRVRNVRGKSGPKSLWLCCFFFPEKCRDVSVPSRSRHPLLHFAHSKLFRPKATYVAKHTMRCPSPV